MSVYFSQCQPKNICLTGDYGQCNGVVHTPGKPDHPVDKHHQCCPTSFACIYSNPDFSQCLPMNVTSNCSQPYQQCGGQDGDGHPWTPDYGHPTCCTPGYLCNKTNDYYSGCIPEPVCTNGRYGQCGGIDEDGHPWNKTYHHDDCCPEGFACSKKDEYFSQCLPTNMTAAVRDVVSRRVVPRA